MARTTTEVPARRLSADDWVRAAFDIMVDEGIAGVKIQRLCDRLGVTKGSFYWHFADLDAFLGELARQWADDGIAVEGKIDLDADPDPATSLRRAMRVFAEPRNRNLARAMRDWARNDDRARAAIRRADRRFFERMKATMVVLGFDDEEAEVRAKILYYTGVGFAAVGSLGTKETAAEQLDATWELLTTRH